MAAGDVSAKLREGWFLGRAAGRAKRRHSTTKTTKGTKRPSLQAPLVVFVCFVVN
jgi:hypothetical protein